jgi:hypothetical protein
MHLSELLGRVIKVNVARVGKYEEVQEDAIWDDVNFKSIALAEQTKPLNTVGKAETEVVEPKRASIDDEPVAKKPSGPIVYLDIDINSQPAGRIEIQLFSNVVPSIVCFI